MSDTSLELHQAALLRNNLLFRAASVINGLQHDTDDLVTATELQHDSTLRLKSASAFSPAAKYLTGAPPNTPVIKIPARFKKSTTASTANTDHAYQRTMHAAAEQRNLLLKRAYDVICNLQSDVDGLVEEVTLTAAVATATPQAPLQPGLASLPEQAQRQAQEAEEAQQHAAEEERKAAGLAEQAEQRAMQEQSKGKLAAAVAASSTAARLRKSAASAQDQVRQLKARADLKHREAHDSFALASAAEHKAQTLEAAGLAQAGPLTPLPYSPVLYSPQSLQTPALLRGLAGASGLRSKGWLGPPGEATSQLRRSLDFGAAPGSPYAGALRGSPGTPGDRHGKLAKAEGEQAQAQLMQATWGRLQAATAAAQYSEQQQASAVAAGQQAQQAAAQVGATHKAASKAKAEVSKLATQASRLKEVGRLEEAKNAQSQAKRWQQTAAQAEQAVAAAEQRERAAAAAAQAAASASFAAEAQAEELTSAVKQLQEATEAGALAISWKKKAYEAVQKAIEVRQAADEHTTQASAAGQRAIAAEQEAQQLEGQGKFADAAAAALQADRWHKAAGDASKRAARLQAEAKAAAAQSDTAQAAARQADHLATCLKMTTAHLQAASSPPQETSGLPSARSSLQTQDVHAKTSVPQSAVGPKLPVLLPSKSQASRAALTGSPSRLSRMTLQDAQTAEEEEPVSVLKDAGMGLRRAGSRVEGTSDGVSNHHAKQKLGLQLPGLNNAETGRDELSMSDSAAVHSPQRVTQETTGGVAARNESAESAVPPWRSNSAAAWVKQKSLDKSLSAGAFANWDQEEEQQPWLQQAEPDQTQAAGSQAGAGQFVAAPGRSDGEGQSAAASGRGRPQGSLRIDVEEQPQQDGLQEWTESGLDDIAAAVAQYTGASPDDLLATENSQQGQQQLPEQLPEQLHRQQHRRHPPEIASLRLTGLRSATHSPRGVAEAQHHTQQELMAAELDAAMAADAEDFAAHHDAQEELELELNTAMMAEISVPKYANAQEQMEAELDAAMAAEMSAPKYANAQEQMEAELDAAMAAEMGAPKYANAQEQMEAELDAAMAADSGTNQDVQHTREDHREQSPQRWQQMDAELDAAMAAKAISPRHVDSPRQHGTPALYGSPSKGRAMAGLELPGDGLDLDADDRDDRPLQLQAVMQEVRITPDWYHCQSGVIPYLRQAAVNYHRSGGVPPHSAAGYR
ncbi:hypothetical protein ABBQ38_015407 [Trebouxia sp. C0009 RCD-2024]